MSTAHKGTHYPIYPVPAERARRLHAMNDKLAGHVVCQRCGATRMTEAMTGCTAELTEVCDGFIAIELAMYPDGRTVDGLAPTEQIASVRAAINGSAA